LVNRGFERLGMSQAAEDDSHEERSHSRLIHRARTWTAWITARAARRRRVSGGFP
jgi:hypothetical protein